MKLQVQTPISETHQQKQGPARKVEQEQSRYHYWGFTKFKWRENRTEELQKAGWCEIVPR